MTLRLNQILNNIIPNLMIAFILFGSRFALLELCPYMILNSSSHSKIFQHLARLHKVVFVFLSTLATSLYLCMYLRPIPTGQFPRCSPHTTDFPEKLPKKIAERTIVYRSADQFGTPATCSLCQGRLLPLRARHCFDCKTCMGGFDHHCVWFAQCITTNITLKPFFQILVIASMTILLGAIPLYPIVGRHIVQVVRLTWHTGSSGDTLRRIWWERWWGWAGGPIYRYLGGLCLGYIHYSEIKLRSHPSLTRAASDTPQTQSGHSRRTRAHVMTLDQPSLAALLVLAAATMILFVILAMIGIVLKNNVFKGVSTLEIERARRWHHSSAWDPRLKLWVPDGAGIGGGKVVVLEPGIPIFDLGAWNNWKLLMGEHTWEWFVPWRTSSQPDGIEWPISEHWMNYLRQLEPLTETPIES